MGCTVSAVSGVSIKNALSTDGQAFAAVQKMVKYFGFPEEENVLSNTFVRLQEVQEGKCHRPPKCLETKLTHLFRDGRYHDHSSPFPSC